MIEPRRFWCDSKARLRAVADEILRLDVGEERIAEIIVRPARKEKTTSQRGYWHVVLDELGVELGYTRGQMKEIIKQEYYGADVVRLPSGQTYEIVQSSEAEDREGYGRLIDFTLQVASEQGVTLRDPRQN